MNDKKKSGEQVGGLHSEQNRSNLTPTNTNTNTIMEVSEIIRGIINEICIEPDKVQVKEQRLGFTSMAISILANATDYGKILGEQRRTLLALQQIAKAKNADLELQQASGGEKRRFPDFRERDDWPRERIENLFENIFRAFFPECAVMMSDGEQGRTALEVVLPGAENRRKVEAVKETMEPLAKTIGMRHGRRIGLTMVQDDMLLQQALMAV